MKARVASRTSCGWLNLPENKSPAKTKTFLTHSCGRAVLIAARSGVRGGTTGGPVAVSGSAGTVIVGCSEVIVSIKSRRAACAMPPRQGRYVATGYRRGPVGLPLRVDQHAGIHHRGRVELG